MKQLNTRLSIYDLNGKAVDTIQLDEKLFDGHINRTLLYEANKMYEANIRGPVASSKTRSEVSGGGVKPWRQKGTGRARVGSSRNPVWRHGGVAFGPRPRDFSYSMTKKSIKGALLSGLNARLLEELIKPVVKIEMDAIKTKKAEEILDKLKVKGKILLVVDTMNLNTRCSFQNIKNISLMEGRNINVRDVLLNEWLVIEKEALEKLSDRVR
ncbi:MAG: 50S ribosomal protein L4 [Candidatus Omnitrophota bacterium]